MLKTFHKDAKSRIIYQVKITSSFLVKKFILFQKQKYFYMHLAKYYFHSSSSEIGTQILKEQYTLNYVNENMIEKTAIILCFTITT